MEWKIDDTSIDWIVAHMDLYYSDQPDAVRTMNELREAAQNRLRDYTGYTKVKNEFLEKLCNNYVAFRSGLYQLTDKSIVITQVEGYLMYQKDSKRWVPIGYLKEKRLPYTNRSFIESTEKGAEDLTRAIAEAREGWIDQEVGNNMRILRDMKGIWFRLAAVMIMLGCDVAMLLYLVDILGTGIWFKLFLCGQAEWAELFRYSLQPEKLAVPATIGMLSSGAIVIVLTCCLLHDVWGIAQARVVRKTIKRYEYLEKCLKKVLLQIRSKDLETMERELHSLKANKAAHRSLMPIGSMRLRMQSLWMRHLPFAVLNTAALLGLLILSVMNLYFIR